MAITPAAEAWLKEAGYRYHCFISWAHTISPEMKECVRRVKTAIETELAHSIDEPKVFLDETGIPPGTLWSPELQDALCHSLTMVAICAPIYYHPAHSWCGLEWAAMEKLGAVRLEGENLTAIFPLIFRRSDLLPEAVARVQHVDLSKEITSTRRYYHTQAFVTKMREIVEQIDRVAGVVVNRKTPPQCETFEFPAVSAFDGYDALPQPFPFREGPA